MRQSSTYQTEFAPPPEPGRGRSFALAAAAHVLLFVALGLVTRWTTQSQRVTAEAELWSSVPQQAAPRLVEPEPTPPPEPKPEPVKPDPSKPAPRPAPEPEVERRDAEIALKKQKEEEKKKALEKEKAEKLRKDKAEKEKAEKEKAEKEKKAKEDKEREKKKAEAEKRQKEEAQNKAEAARAEALRKENLQRMQGLAGATGGEHSTGTALKSSGPSASYAGKIVRLILENTNNPENSPGVLTVEVFVKTSASGEIVSSRVTKSSGRPAFDEAVLRGIQKMERVPRDADNRIPEMLIREGLLLTVTR